MKAFKKKERVRLAILCRSLYFWPFSFIWGHHNLLVFQAGCRQREANGVERLAKYLKII
jgi:hypothetical protein